MPEPCSTAPGSALLPRSAPQNRPQAQYRKGSIGKSICCALKWHPGLIPTCCLWGSQSRPIAALALPCAQGLARGRHGFCLAGAVAAQAAWKGRSLACLPPFCHALLEAPHELQMLWREFTHPPGEGQDPCLGRMRRVPHGHYQQVLKNNGTKLFKCLLKQHARLPCLQAELNGSAELLWVTDNRCLGACIPLQWLHRVQRGAGRRLQKLLPCLWCWLQVHGVLLAKLGNI